MEKRGAQKWTWISDFHGFSTSDCSPKSMMLVKRMLAHYPERLFKAVMLDAPWIFNGLWNMVSPLLEQRTRDKVSFVKSHELSDWSKSIDAGEELAHFLHSEIQSNRQDPSFWKDEGKEEGSSPQGKKYWIPNQKTGVDIVIQKEAASKDKLKSQKPSPVTDFRATAQVAKDSGCTKILFQYSLS
mmetsp:Transcript_25093/g.40295  ORF Transcript_25093/g.40295 Transcript_25093/m.40295 type:complete len:185 (+) Transcript_25093:201-755(+)